MTVSSDPRFPSDRSRDARGASTVHGLQLHESDRGVCDLASDYLADSLESGGSGLVVASEDRRHDIASHLRARGIDLHALTARGRYVALDTGAMLERVAGDGAPDAASFHAYLRPLVHHAAACGQRDHVRAYDETASSLWRAGRRPAALALERLWNELRERRPVGLLCSYPLRCFDHDGDPALFRALCAEHGRVLPTESYVRASPEERLRCVADLQQIASVHDAEVRRRRDLENLLTRRELELADLLERTPEAVVEIDAEGRVRWANSAHRALLGETEEDDAERVVTDFLARREDFDETWTRLLKGVRVEDVPLEVRTRRGEPMRLSLHRASLRLVDGALRMRWFLRPLGGDGAS